MSDDFTIPELPPVVPIEQPQNAILYSGDLTLARKVVSIGISLLLIVSIFWLVNYIDEEGVFSLRPSEEAISYQDTYSEMIQLDDVKVPKENILNYSKFKIGASKLPIKFEYIKLLNNKFISKITDINDVDDIKKLTNESIFINKSELPKLSNDEIYWHDLIGMQAINIKDQNLGVIEEINNYGASDILKVVPTKASVDKEGRE